MVERLEEKGERGAKNLLIANERVPLSLSSTFFFVVKVFSFPSFFCARSTRTPSPLPITPFLGHRRGESFPRPVAEKSGEKAQFYSARERERIETTGSTVSARFARRRLQQRRLFFFSTSTGSFFSTSKPKKPSLSLFSRRHLLPGAPSSPPTQRSGASTPWSTPPTPGSGPRCCWS